MHTNTVASAIQWDKTEYTSALNDTERTLIAQWNRNQFQREASRKISFALHPPSPTTAGVFPRTSSWVFLSDHPPPPPSTLSSPRLGTCWIDRPPRRWPLWQGLFFRPSSILSRSKLLNAICQERLRFNAFSWAHERAHLQSVVPRSENVPWGRLCYTAAPSSTHWPPFRSGVGGTREAGGGEPKSVPVYLLGVIVEQEGTRR